MCEKKQFRYCPSEIDSCMVDEIESLQNQGMNTLGCCCGHGKYPKTIVVRLRSGTIIEMFSNKLIPRKRRFYKRDDEGYYHIPELIN